MTSIAQNKLDALLEKEKQLKKQIASEKAKLNAEEKKRDTRRKILVGAYFLDAFKEKPQELIHIMDQYLTRQDDRTLFGLPPVQPPQILQQEQYNDYSENINNETE